MKNFILFSFVILMSTNIYADTPPPTVDVVSVNQQQWQPAIQVTGIIKAIKSATITSEATGRITKMNFKDGDTVQKNSVIYELNADILKAQLKLNLASLTLSKLQYKRKAELAEQNAVSTAELDVAKATLQTDEAKVAQIKAQLDQKIIKAPFTGKLGFAKAYPGDYITAGQALVNLQMVNPMSMELTIPEIFSSKIKTNQDVTVWSDAYYGQKFQGKISAIDIEVNQLNQSIKAKATIPNPIKTLIPGSFMNAKINLASPKVVLTIPQICVQYENDGPYVYKVIDNKAVKTTITLGPPIQNDFIVLTGLNKSDKVVSEGQIKLTDNTEIAV